MSKFIAYCGLDCEKCEARTATVNNDNEFRKKLAVKFLEKLGVNFKRQFDAETYEKFFVGMGYEKAGYEIVSGRMSCDVAELTLKNAVMELLKSVGLSTKNIAVLESHLKQPVLWLITDSRNRIYPKTGVVSGEYLYELEK